MNSLLLFECLMLLLLPLIQFHKSESRRIKLALILLGLTEIILYCYKQPMLLLYCFNFIGGTCLIQQKQRTSVLILALLFLCFGFGIGMLVLYPQTLLMVLGMMTCLYYLFNINQSYLRKSYEDSTNEYQNKILKKQVDEVQNIYLIMRGWRHDYHNHLQNLKAQLKMNQIDQAKAYLNELEADLDDIHQLVETGNVNCDAILNSKLSLLLKDNVKMDIKANVPAQLAIQDIDLCVLLGNLIDNAHEAIEKMDEGERFIRLYIGIFKKQLYISVTNSTHELVRKLDEEYITTKRGNHGHGLKRINRIVEKYDGYINRKNEPGVFVTEIMLPM